MLKKLLFAMAALAFGLIVLGADNQTETWKLNPAKSKPAKSRQLKAATVTIATEGDTIKVSIDDTGIDDQKFSFKYTVPATGGPITDTEVPPGFPAGTTDVLKRIDDRTSEITSTLNGKVVLKQHIVISPDHKTMRVTESGVDQNGNPFKSLYVYDSQ
jgi:uncharacterized lipoprotein NlpE involved in copper resistance